MPIKIVLVEDHPAISKEIQHILKMDTRFHLERVCCDLPEAEQLIDNYCPDLLLVDLGLPSGSGITLLQRAQSKWGQCCVSAVLIVLENEKNLIASVAAGAKGFFYKHNFTNELNNLIKLTQGQSYVNAVVAQLLYQKISEKNTDAKLKDDKQLLLCLTILNLRKAGYDMQEQSQKLGISEKEIGLHIRWIYDQLSQEQARLSARELELLLLLDKNFTNKECALQMQISENTTKTYIKRIFQKFDVRTIRAAINEAKRGNLLQ